MGSDEPHKRREWEKTLGHSVWMENLHKFPRNWVTWRERREALYIASVLNVISERSSKKRLSKLFGNKGFTLQYNSGQLNLAKGEMLQKPATSSGPCQFTPVLLVPHPWDGLTPSAGFPGEPLPRARLLRRKLPGRHF